MAYQNIPEELRALPQWVCAQADKKPLNSRDQSAASVLNPDTWGTFEEACLAGTPHQGFVLTDEDPYCIIDLDQPRNEVDADRQKKIIDSFDTYIERSQSGNGFHIICRGKVPEGARRDKVEVYSTARYMITTGHVVKDRPIADCQPLLDILYQEIKRTSTSAQPIDEAETITDADLIERAMRASNAEKFNTLCAGDWQDYPSQSEADLALLSIIAFYSNNNEQVKRLFRYSALGKREKATKNDTYLNYAIKRIRSNQPRMIDFGEVFAMAEAATPVIPGTYSPRPLTFPKGLIGEVAEYILQQAVRPVPEIALASAIAYIAGICGRCFNVSGTGLNQYLLVLAKTGSGKEGGTTGIERLTAAIRTQIPMVDQFIGPAAFASGQALIKVLDQHQCFVSVMGEFGLTLQQLSDPRANSSTVMLKKVLLDLYTKSGWDNVLRSSVYADSEKNTKIVQAPCVTILGESTPEAFFENISSTHISEGLIPRFMVIEYLGGRPTINPKAGQKPPADLVKALVNLVTRSLTMQANRSCYDVPIDKHAEAILHGFNLKADGHMNANASEVEAQLWNRAHLKALKLSALMAVGMDSNNPTINTDCARWAVQMVDSDVKAMLEHFTEGSVGSGDAKQVFDVRKKMEKYMQGEVGNLKSSGATSKMIKDKVVPLCYLQRQLYPMASFRNDRLGAGNALKKTLALMLEAGIIQEVPKPQMMEKYSFRMTAYVVGCAW